MRPSARSRVPGVEDDRQIRKPLYPIVLLTRQAARLLQAILKADSASKFRKYYALA
jgi:hypothetical protein